MNEHHNGNKFKNPYLQTRMPNFWRILHWQLKTRKKPRTDNFERIEVTPPDMHAIGSPDNKPQVTWIGHSTVLIQHRGLSILTDPIFSDRASPFSFLGPLRYTRPALTAETLPPIDIVVISHNHYDHLDVPSVRALGNAVLWVVPLGLKNWLKNLGIANAVELDWWESHTLQDTVITCAPAQHWSRRGLADMNKTLWSSWAIKIDDFNFWFGGDTGYNTYDFKEIGSRLGPFDASAIPIGAYLPEWIMKSNHLGPAHAVQVHQDIQSAWSFGIHWGTFILADELVHEPLLDLEKAVRKAGLAEKNFTTLAIGETKSIDSIR